MRVLIAFDKFKGSLTAEEACGIAAGAIREAHPDWDVDECPLTDGGDGFAGILTNAARLRQATAWQGSARVSDPLGRTIQAGFGLITGLESNVAPSVSKATADRLAHARRYPLGIIDMASASGLALLEPAERDPWVTSSRGTGELIAAAIAAGAKEILVGIGGSATNDLGLGALAALGLVPVDGHGAPVEPLVPKNFHRIARLTGKPLDHARGDLDRIPIQIASDVTNSLLGKNGAAAVYGPQKGLRPEDVRKMDHEACRIALMLCHHFGKPESLIDAPGSGAAGGFGFGFAVAAGAKIVPGAALVAEWLGLDRRIEEAEVVITGEGAFDATSLAGKATGELIKSAQAKRKKVIVFSGFVTGDHRGPGVSVQSINPEGEPVAESMKHAKERLRAAVRARLGK